MPGVIKKITAQNVHEVIAACKQAPYVGLDTETTALHPKDGAIRLIQLAVKGTCYILDCFRNDARMLLPIFDGNTLLIGHNLAFDLRFLWSVGIEVPHGRKLFDTMIAGQLLDAGILPRKSHRLDVMVPEYCGFDVPKEEQKSDWSRPELTVDQWRYAARDSEVLLPLYEELQKRIQSANLTRTMRLEMRALPGIVWLTMSGIKVNRDGWNTLADKNQLVVESIEQELAELTDSADLFGFSLINWRSPKQVIDTFNKRFAAQGKGVRRKVMEPCPNPACNFHKRGEVCEFHSKYVWKKIPYTIEDTTDDTLAALANDGDALAKMLLRYRKSVKLRDTYGRNWSEQFIHTDSRVYSDYRQLGAFSGRMSCTNPNCQQVPHSHDFRGLFIPEDGYRFVISDLSQIELRICVEMSRDPVGMQAYCVDGTDLHKSTAELILGIDLKNDPAEKIGEARQVAKSLNFGLIFGAGSETMRLYAQSAFGVHLEPDRAAELRNAWREIYKGIVAWQKRVRDGVETVYTLGGRRRLNVDKFTEKLNTPVQGTGADGLKAAIALCYERRHQMNSAIRPVAAVHDELVFEAPAHAAQDTALWVKQNMEEGMQSFLKVVPVVAEAKVAISWAEK